ncbi:MAG: S8 family serine peptidase [Limisphaerales bacterium]
MGATESLRNIPATTNFQTALEESDTDEHVASFSSRGNVGVGLEGDFGRFKPDLVTPGTWILSLRASNFHRTNLTSHDTTIFGGNTNGGGLRYESGTSMSAPVVSGMLSLMEEYFQTHFLLTNSPAMSKALLINGARPASGQYDYATRNFQNLQGWGMPALTNTLPENSDFKFLDVIGSSQQATTVAVEQSGLGTNRIHTGQTHHYQLTVDDSAKDRGIRVTLLWTDPPGNPAAGVKLVNDLDLVVSNTVDGDNYIGNFFVAGSDFTESGEPGSTNLNQDVQRDFVNNVENVFIRGPLTNSGAVTLDIKVLGNRVNVNSTGYDTNDIAQDYVLVVSTDIGHEITLTHDPSRDFTTNRVTSRLLNGIPLQEERVGANYPHFPMQLIGSTNQWNFYIFTNQNLPPFAEMSTNVTGTQTNVSTNTVRPLTNAGRYVAFATFFPPNIGKTRNTEADIDLYVTRGGKPPAAGAPAITNLDTSIFTDANTLLSTNRGGEELVTLDDSSLGEVFYLGVKSEDQQGGEYGLVAISTADGFTQTNADGTIGIPFFPTPLEIPDGAPSAPGGISLFGIGLISTNIISAEFTNSLAHQAYGDLTAILSHDGENVFLWNHNSDVSPGIFSTQRRLFNMVSSNAQGDGPGSFADFFNANAIGLWTLTVVDDAFNHTGMVVEAGLRIGDNVDNQNRNRMENGNQTVITFDVDPGESFIDLISVPLTATNLNVAVQGAPNTDPGIDLLVAYDEIPAAPFFTNTFVTNINGTNYQVTNVNVNSDILALLAPDTATMGIDVNAASIVPLTPGIWFARVVNNTSTRQSLTLVFTLEHNFAINETRSLEAVLDHDLPDYGSTNFVLGVPEFRTIAELDVLISIDHPRPSDLVIDLFSPSGSKVLLAENRGDLSRTNFHVNFTEDTNLTTSLMDNVASGTMIHLTNLLPIKAVTNQFTNLISPPLLLNSNVLGMVGSHTQPEAIYSPGNSLYACGSLITNAVGSQTNWGLAFNYPVPMRSNTVLTNWLSIWPDPSGVGPSSQVNGDNTVFKDLVVLPEGVFMVGVSNKDYFPVLPNAQGDSNSVTLDIDTGTTNGGINFAIQTFVAEDHYHVYYNGGLLLAEPFPGIGTMGFTNYHLPFGPAGSSFVRLAINQGNSTNPFTLWQLQSLSISNAASVTPTNQSIILGIPNTGPVVGGAAGNGATVLSRGVTNNPYISGADRLYGIDYSTETVTNAFGVPVSSNYLFVVGSAQYNATGDEKFFLSKVTTAGFPVWTATEQVVASASATESGGVITSIDVVCGGTNYTTAPTVTIVDLYDAGSGAAAVATIGANGNVTGISVTSGGTGYLRPAVFISKPALPATTFPSAGLDLVVVSNTHVFTVGYSNVNAGGATVAPHIRAYDTNGCLIWARNSGSGTDGPYYAVAAARTNIWAVGAHDAGAGNTASTIERWDVHGNLIVSTNYTHLSETAGSPEDSFNDVLAISCPDRVYAIGTRTNSDSSTDAILVEINAETLEAISSTVLDSSGGGNDRGMSLTTDGRDLYALVQTTAGGQRFSEVYRFRIKNYYLPEEHLYQFRGEATWFVNGGFVNSNWTLRVTDTRVGGTNVQPKMRCWGLNFTYAANGIPFSLITTTRGFTGSLLGHNPSYYSFAVPPGVTSATLHLNSTGPLSAAISNSGLPSFEPGGGSTVLLANGPGGTFELSADNGFNLRPGVYYVALQPGIEAPTSQVSLNVSFDGDGPPPTIIPLLNNGALENGTVSAGVGFSLYSFEVPTNSGGARFELTGLSADLNLYLRKGAVPLANEFDYRSVHGSANDESIFIVPDGTTRGLTPGTWVLGVENNTGLPQSFGIRATSLEGSQVYNIVNVSSGQQVSGVTTVGNAPNNLYKLEVAASQRALLFELRNLQGSGDLVIRKGLPPNRNNYSVRGLSGGANLPESIPVRTSAQDITLLGDWFFGVINHGETNVSYTAVAKQPENGLLISDSPVQLVSIPNGTSLSSGQEEFGFGLQVIPGERYQIQRAESPTGPWFIIATITASPDAVIEFVDSNALANPHLFYRVQQVPSP